MSTGHTITSRTLMARHLFIRSRALLAASATRSRAGIVFCLLSPSTTRAFSAQTLPSQAGPRPCSCRVLVHPREVQALPLVRPASVQLLTGQPSHLPGFPWMASLGHRNGPPSSGPSPDIVAVASTGSCVQLLNCTGHRRVPCAAHNAPVCPRGLQVGCEPLTTALSA